MYLAPRRCCMLISARTRMRMIFRVCKSLRMHMLLLLFALLLQLPPVSCSHFIWLRQDSNRDLQPTRISREISVNGAAAAKGYVVFASVDKRRPLSLVCAQRDCTIYTEEVSRNPHTGDVHYRVDVKVGLIRLEYAGSLMVCIGPKDLFRKIPLIHIERDVRCTGGNPRLLPHFEAEEFYPVTAYTWFMTKENYQELREGNKTEVFVPLFTQRYKLPFLFGYCWHLPDQKAVLQTPSSEKFLPTTEYFFPGLRSSYSSTSKCEMFTLYIDAAVENSGDYVAGFRGRVLYTPYYSVSSYGTFYQPQVKTVTISFFRGPKITIVGHKDHRVVFPPQETAGTFTVNIYTTSQVVAFRVQRSDGDPQGQQMLTEFVSYPSNSIIAKYRVGIPWMSEKLNGIYTISVTNRDGESATQNVRIEKAAPLEILVSPKQQIVGEVTPVSYECLVVGHPVSNISWARDFEALSPEKYNIQTGVFGEDGNGLRLTFLSPRLNDSGVYVCSCYNQFETVQSTVDLAVFPPGSPYIDPTYEAKLTGVSPANGTTEVEGSNHTLIAGNDLVEEYGGGPRRKGGTYTIVAVVLVALVAVAVLVIIVAVVVCTMRLCRRRQQSRTKSIKPQAHPEQRKLISQESRFQLVADTFRSETEMGKEWLNPEVSNSHGDESVEQGALLKVGLESNSGDLEVLEPKKNGEDMSMGQTIVGDSGNLEAVLCVGKSGRSKKRRGRSMKKKEDTRERDKT